MLRHKILCTDVQRIKIQEISLSPLPLSTAPSSRDSSSSLPQQRGNNTHSTHNNTSTHHPNHNHHTRKQHHPHESNHTSNEGNSSSADCRAPRTFEFEIRGALVNRCCIAGDIVNVIGIVKTASAVRIYIHGFVSTFLYNNQLYVLLHIV